MKTNTISSSGTNVIVVALGLLAALLVFMALTGRKMPLLSSDRAVLLAIAVIGMVMCTQGGIGPMAARGAWLHPLSIIGYVLGAVIVLIGIAAVFGKLIPLLASYHQSIIVVAAIAAIKVVLTAVHRVLL